MFARLAGLVAASAAGLFAAAPATAQGMADLSEAQRIEIMCVYDQIVTSDLLYAVGDSYLFTGDVDSESEEGKKLLVLEQSCATKHGWDKDRRELASAISILAAANDVLIEEDLFDVTDEQIESVFATVDEITDADYEAFVSGMWNGDTAMETRVTALLKKNGFPTVQEGMGYTGMLLMEVNILGSELVGEWIDRWLS